MTNCYGSNGPWGPIKETIMTFLIRNPIVRCVLLIARGFLEIQPILGLHAQEVLDIGVKMRMQRPYDVEKSSISLRDLGMMGEVVETTNILEDIPLKPLDMVGKN